MENQDENWINLGAVNCYSSNKVSYGNIEVIRIWGNIEYRIEIQGTSLCYHVEFGSFKHNVCNYNAKAGDWYFNFTPLSVDKAE